MLSCAPPSGWRPVREQKEDAFHRAPENPQEFFSAGQHQSHLALYTFQRRWSCRSAVLYFHINRLLGSAFIKRETLIYLSRPVKVTFKDKWHFYSWEKEKKTLHATDRRESPCCKIHTWRKVAFCCLLSRLMWAQKQVWNQMEFCLLRKDICWGDLGIELLWLTGWLGEILQEASGRELEQTRKLRGPSSNSHLGLLPCGARQDSSSSPWTFFRNAQGCRISVARGARKPTFQFLVSPLPQEEGKDQNRTSAPHPTLLSSFSPAPLRTSF